MLDTADEKRLREQLELMYKILLEKDVLSPEFAVHKEEVIDKTLEFLQKYYERFLEILDCDELYKLQNKPEYIRFLFDLLALKAQLISDPEKKPDLSLQLKPEQVKQIFKIILRERMQRELTPEEEEELDQQINEFFKDEKGEQLNERPIKVDSLMRAMSKPSEDFGEQMDNAAEVMVNLEGADKRGYFQNALRSLTDLFSGGQPADPGERQRAAYQSYARLVLHLPELKGH